MYSERRLDYCPCCRRSINASVADIVVAVAVLTLCDSDDDIVTFEVVCLSLDLSLDVAALLCRYS